MLSRFLFMAGCVALSGAQALAQAQTELPEIVVTGNPFQSKDLSTPVERLSGAALLQRPSGGLGETLSGLPGVSSTYFGSTSSRPIIRGLDGDRIRILNNGASSSDASGLSFDHAVASSPLAMESVEVVRGPAALMYGGSAVGGVVNMLDNRIVKSAMFDEKGGRLGRVQAGYATGNRERTGAAMLETGTDKYALHIDAFGNKSGEANAPIAMSCTQNSVTRVQNKICNTQAQTSGGAFGASVFLNQGYLGASVDRTQQLYGSPAEANVNLKMERTSYRLEGEKRDLRLLGGLVQGVSGHVVSHSYQHRELNSGAVATTFLSTGVDSKLQARLASFNVGANSVDTLFGWQRERIHFEAIGSEAFVPRSLTQSQALYGLQALNAPWGKLTAGVRLERADINSLGIDGNTNFTPANRSLEAKSYALGSLFKLDAITQGLSGSVDFARTGRIPKDYELYANGEHAATGSFEMGDANLAVERSRHFELGLKWQANSESRRRFDKTSLNVFQTRYDNYIFLRATGNNSTAGNPEFQFTATPARFTGWEWTGGTRLVEASSQQPKALDVEARASAVEATNTATNQPLPRIAPLRMGVDWTLSQAAWKWTLGADKTYDQNRVATNQPATAGYTLWNAGVSFEQKNTASRALWFAKLRNAGNALGYPATSILTQTAAGRVPLPGRSLQVGVQVGF
jgi:iron complex outermembrane recepter protein